MKPIPLTEPGPTFWEDGLLDSRLEAQLAQSIENVQRPSLPRVQTAVLDANRLLQSTTLTGLLAGCGVAAIDGYLAIKDYAAAKNLDLIEFKNKGIDLQDLISTLIINASQQQTNGQRWKR